MSKKRITSPAMGVSQPTGIWKKRLREISPMTKAQSDFFDYYDKGYNVVLSGSAGCGKTFIALYKALEESKASQYKKRVVLVRSAVPTREMGYLPGSKTEKEAAYITPYIGIVNELYGDPKAWETLFEKNVLQFITTSYIRGITLRNSIVIVDECANLTMHELDSVITRLGEGSRIIFAGDYHQSDFTRDSDKAGLKSFLSILDKMNYFKHVVFTWEDICRSGLVRDYIMTKDQMEL